MIQLIASDMDGTLLNAKLQISQRNVEAIKLAEEKGITFMVATGRGFTEAKPALEEANIQCPMITVNGAQAFDKEGNELFTIDIPKKTVQRIMQVLEDNLIYFEVATTQGVYSNNRMQRLENVATMLAEKLPHITFKMATAMAAAHMEVMHISYIDDYNDLLENPEIKILKLIGFSQKGQSLLQTPRKQLEMMDDLVVTSSFETNIEINHIDAQKGNAVAHMANMLNIPLEKVMTIGDNFNDVSMLKIAGVSFAMENAEEEVKEVAKYLTDSHLVDGVGKAIEQAIAKNL